MGETEPKLPQLRDVGGWRDDPIFPTISLKTTLPIDRELWMLLHSYSEARERGKKLLINRYHVPRKKFGRTWKRYRAFIRQAQNYWEAAKKTNYKSSSLLYYYSFLNLVKAYLLLKDPDLPLKMKHGLSYNADITTKGLGDKCLTIHKGPNQIFWNYYKDVFGSNPPSTLRIISLFSHMTDIAYQYEDGGFGKRRIFPCIHRIAVDNRRQISWIVLSVPNSVPIRYFGSIYRKFFDEFEQVQTPKTASISFRELFGFKSIEWSRFNFYQTKQGKEMGWINSLPIPPSFLTDKLRSILFPWIEPNFYEDNFTFYLNFPSNRIDKYAMNEEISIYCAMFFMSELVRYRPDYLDNIFDSKAAWLLESFVESCPLKFLRAITSRIVGLTVKLSTF